MASLTLTDSEVWVRDLVGTRSLLAGRALAGTGAVVSVTGDLADGLVATVTADGRRFDVEARPRPGRDGSPARVDGSCTCGLAVPCRHAVAALLTARDRSGARPVPAAPAAALTLAPAPWQGALDTVLREPRPRRAPAATCRGGTPHGLAGAAPAVALQFEVTDDPHARVAVRLVGPGRSGAWVRSAGLSWSLLHYGDHYLRHLPPAHVRLLRELSALPTTAPQAHRDKVLALDAVRSRRVVDLLAEAQETGLPLVMSGRRAEPVRVHAAPAAARVDISRAGGGLVVRPLLDLPGHGTDPAGQVLLLGDPPYALAWTVEEPGIGLQLARLTAPPPRLFDRLDSGGPVHVPAADEQRFLTEYYPQLTARIEVVSRDGSVELPAQRPPALALAVHLLGGHRLDLSWSWCYPIGAGHRSEPLDLPPGPASDWPTRRDAEAEAAALARVTPVLHGGQGDGDGDPALVELTARGARPARDVRLEGLASARFMAETMPRLRDLGVQVSLARVRSAPADYRRLDAVPVVSFTPTQDGPGADGSGSGQGDAEDWFDLSVAVTVDGLEVPFRDLFVALAQERSHLLLDDGAYFGLDRPEFEELRRLIVESRDLLDAPAGTVRLSRFHAGLWADVERLGTVDGTDPRVERWRRTVAALAPGDGTPTVHPVPAGLRATLRPYQRAGFEWLAALHALRLGGVLADDMGLGKTLQALALVLHTREQGLTDLPFLVVAPTSVVGNWAAEAHRFAPGLRVATITQTAARRGHDVATAVADADLVVTSYTLFRLEFEEYRTRSWAGLLLDEAQNVKNHASAGYRCAKELPAGLKVAITGTPMENNLMELWSLLSITAPGLFARPDRFTEHYRHPIEREHDGDRLAQLRRRIRPLLLRRTKDQVAPDLPDRQEQVLDLELNPRHRAVYARYLQRERQKVLGLLGDLQRNRFEVFRSLTLLRQAALDVSLVDPAHAGVPSTKLDALTEHLTGVVAEGHRVLVFSQFTRFLALARQRLDDAGIEYCYLDGTTRNRPQVISRFRHGEAPVFLISLKAGGAGLNLTEADYVVLLDPWWNPATEAQAVDRAHRIGQTRKVMVYRMVAQGTIEEKVMALKERKAALTAGVLHGEEFASAALTAEDIRGLLTP